MRHGLMGLSLLLVLTVGATGCKSFGSDSKGLSLWERMRPGSSSKKMAAAQTRQKELASQKDPEEVRPSRMSAAWDRLCGRDPSAKQQADMQIAFAQMQESQGSIEGAIKSYEEALEQDPNRADAHWRLATLLDKQGMVNQSDEHFQKAIAKDSKNADLRTDYGYSLHLRGETDDAEKQLRTALKLEPNNRRAHNNLGLVLTSQERPDEALREFRKAGCNKAEAHANLGFALALQGNMSQAEEAYQSALVADPNLRSAQDGLKGLSSAVASMQEAETLRAERGQLASDHVDQAEATTSSEDENEDDVAGKSTSRIRRVRPVLFGKPSAK